MLSTSEQSCIRNELGDELLESVLGQRAMSEGETQQWEVSTFGCLDPETAAGLFLSSFLAGMGEVSEEAEDCLRELVAETNVVELISSTSLDADPGSAAGALEFTLGLLACVPEQLLSGGSEPGAGPSPSTDESLLWSFHTEDWVVISPAVANGIVYAGSDDNHVYALDAETGALLWSFETGGVIRSSPTVANDIVYVGSNDNHVYALDASTRDLLWSHDTGDWAQYSPTVRDGVVYLGAVSEFDQKIHALDGLTGRVLWVAEMPYPFSPEFTPTVVGDKVYVPGEFGEYNVLDAETGALAWSLQGVRAESPPTVIGGVVYLTAINTAYALDDATEAVLWSYGTDRFPARDFAAVITDGVYYLSPDNFLYALDIASGEPLWSYEADSMISTRPLVAGGMVYAGTDSGGFYALDAATGEVVWSLEPEGWMMTSPMVVEGVLYAESSDGNLRALDSATGEVVWSFQKGYFSGVQSYTVADGVLYVGSLDNSIYAFAAPTAPVAATAEERLPGLWAGDLIPEPGQTGVAPAWLAMRIRPGEDPDEDQWRLESGPWPSILPPVALCSPQRRQDGWELSSCTGIVNGNLVAFMHSQSDRGLEVTFQSEEYTVRGTLTSIAPRNEPRSTDNVTLLWHQPGEGIHTDIWADGSLVFAPRFDGVIEIMSAEDGKIVGHFEGWGAVMDFDVHDGLLYAGTNQLGLLILDISDPSTPELIGHFEAPATEGAMEGYTSFHNIFLSPDGNFVYATNYSAFPKTELLVIDVSDPAEPIEAGSFSISTDTSEFTYHVSHDVNVIEVNGRLIAFLNYVTAGLWILDVTDPAAISPLGSIAWEGIFSHSGWPFSLGDRLYYAHNSEGYDRHMTILDVTDPASPIAVSRFFTRQGVSIHNVHMVDAIAYISYYIDGLRVVDLRNPEMPKEIAHFDTVPDANERGIVQGAFGVRVVDGTVYVSDMESGTYAFKVDVE